MFTSGTDITTAVTDLINAALALFLMCRLIRKGTGTARGRLWVVTFILFIMVSCTGFVIHGLTAASGHEINQLWRKVLMVEMAFMLAFYTLSILCDIYGAAVLRRAMPVILTLAAVFSVAAVLLMGRTTYGFTIFVVYCLATLLFLIVLLIRNLRRKKGLPLYLAATLLLFAANYVQTIKAIQFRLIWDFNYDSVYHFMLFLFVLIQYRGICRTADPGNKVND